MSTNTPPTTSTIEPGGGQPLQSDDSFDGFIYNFFRIASSMWVTMVLLVAAMFLVFTGTLAQAVRNPPSTLQVANDYFRCWSVWIEFRAFFPPAYFPCLPEIPKWISFPFPGGWTIGLLLVINMFLSVGSKIRLAQDTFRRVFGLFVTLTGIVCTAAVIHWSNLDGGATSTAEVNWTAVWHLFIAFVGLLWIGALATIIVFTLRQWNRYRETGKFPARASSLWTLMIVVVVALGIFLWWALSSLFGGGENIQPNDSSMRILLQLMRTTFAACWLLLGCQLLFARKGASAIIHGGIVLMMVGELLVATMAVESLMTIPEGETVNYTTKPGKMQLVFIEPASGDQTEDTVISVPGSLLQKSATELK